MRTETRREIHPDGSAASNPAERAAPGNDPTCRFYQAFRSARAVAPFCALEQRTLSRTRTTTNAWRRATSHFNQITQRGLKQILDWEKALGQSSNRTLER